MMRLQIFYSVFIWCGKSSAERRESRGVFWQDDSRQVGKSGKLRRGYIVWARRPGHDGGLSDAACASQDRGFSGGEAGGKAAALFVRYVSERWNRVDGVDGKLRVS